MRDSDQNPATTLEYALGTNEAFSSFSRLGVSLLLTDPNRDDNPIVYVNDAFELTTGYSRAAAIGRNCRFLQGEGTDKRDVDRLRAAIGEGRDVSVDILNYRANGTSFLNRLIIAPVLDSAGKPLFFLGIQKELVDSDRGGDNRITSAHLQVLKTTVRRDLAMILQALREPREGEPPLSGREVEALPRRLETLQLVYEEMRHARTRPGQTLLDLGGLIGRLASAISHVEGRAGIRFIQLVDSCDVRLDVATRIALIVSEVLHNAFNHAFRGLDEGRIELRVVRLTGGAIRLMVSDDGVGLDNGTVWPGPQTAGGRLVRDLLNGLDATMNVARGAAGTVVLIDVPVDLTA